MTVDRCAAYTALLRSFFTILYVPVNDGLNTCHVLSRVFRAREIIHLEDTEATYYCHAESCCLLPFKIFILQLFKFAISPYYYILLKFVIGILFENYLIIYIYH